MRGSFSSALKSMPCLWGTLMATRLSIHVSSARYTDPNPPLPSADTMRYFPTVCPRKNMEDNVRIARHGPQRANTKWREYTSR